MLKAQSIYYAIIVSLIVALTCGLLIALSQLQGSQLNEQLENQRLVRNVRSGMALLRAGASAYEGGQYMDIFGKGTDSIRLWATDWGLFSIGGVQAFGHTGFLRDTVEKIMLLGARENPSINKAIYLTDMNRPLTLAGSTVVRGDVVLPKAGVKRGTVDGRANMQKNIVNGRVLQSGPFLPKLDRPKVVQLLSMFERPPNMDQVPNGFFRSFADSTTVFHIPCGSLRSHDIVGNVIIIADQEIMVGSSSHLEDIVLYAPKIVFEQGFAGSLQAFATEEVVIGKNCRFDYPTVIGLIQTTPFTQQPTKVHIDEGTEIKGLVWVQTEQIGKIRPLVVIEKGAVVEGQVWVDGEVDLKGSIIGNVSCNLFVLQMPNARYENHLLDATVNQQGLSDKYLSPLIFTEKKTGVETVKWLY